MLTLMESVFPDWLLSFWRLTLLNREYLPLWATKAIYTLHGCTFLPVFLFGLLGTIFTKKKPFKDYLAWVFFGAFLPTVTTFFFGGYIWQFIALMIGGVVGAVAFVALSGFGAALLSLLLLSVGWLFASAMSFGEKLIKPQQRV